MVTLLLIVVDISKGFVSLHFSLDIWTFGHESWRVSFWVSHAGIGFLRTLGLVN